MPRGVRGAMGRAVQGPSGVGLCLRGGSCWSCCFLKEHGRVFLLLEGKGPFRKLREEAWAGTGLVWVECS